MSKKIIIIGPHSKHTERWIDYFKNKKQLSTKFIYYPYFTNWKDYIIATIKSIFNFIKMSKKNTIINIHFIGNFCFIYSIFLNKNIILSAWGDDVLITPGLSKFRRFLFLYSIKKAKYITSDTENILRTLNVVYNVPKEKLKLFRFGTDTNKWVPVIRKKENTVKVISLRKFYKEYDIPTLIECANIISKKKKDVEFFIYGDGPEKKNIIELIKKYKLRNVHIKGSYSEEDMRKILPTMDIYVSTSISDGGLSASTAEAMACGVYPIVTNFGDNKFWVTPGENGDLFKIGDYKRLSELIINYNPNNKKYIDYKIKSRKKIINYLNYEKEMHKFYKFIINLEVEHE